MAGPCCRLLLPSELLMLGMLPWLTEVAGDGKSLLLACCLLSCCCWPAATFCDYLGAFLQPGSGRVARSSPGECRASGCRCLSWMVFCVPASTEKHFSEEHWVMSV